MAAVTFQRATRKQAKLRMAIDGPAGSGKTYTGLIAARAIANGAKVAVIDTEHGSASKYADLFEFDVLELSNFSPVNYIDGIREAERAGYSVILIDSLSHAWEGEGGVLEMHDAATKREPGGNSYTAWRNVTPLHRDLVEAILQSKAHIIATMRSKMEYIQSKDDNGKTSIKKVGMAPIQRQGMEYEFDVVADMDLEHNLVVSKTRLHFIADAVVNKPTSAWFAPIREWLDGGAPVAVTLPDWTKSETERGEFRAWRERNSLTDADCKRLASEYKKVLTVAKTFAELGFATREELCNAIEAQIARESALKVTA